MSILRFHFPLRALLGAIVALSIIGGCVKTEKTDAKKEVSYGKITGYNHTPEYIHQYYLDESWGGNVHAYGGGGGFVCCVGYPKQWRPDLKVKVRWSTSSSDPKATGDAAEGKWHEMVVPIEKYVESGGVHVHFLPDGKVRVLVSRIMAGWPGYLGPPYPVQPKDFKFGDPETRSTESSK